MNAQTNGIAGAEHSLVFGEHLACLDETGGGKSRSSGIRARTLTRRPVEFAMFGFGDLVDPPPAEITPRVLLPLGAGFRSGSGRVQVGFRIIHLISLVSAHTSAENTVGFSHGNELL